MSGQVIKGVITDKSSGEPLPFANIVILHAPDSVYVSGTISNEKGEFSLPVHPDKYFLKVSYLGYKIYIAEVIHNNCGTIKLEASSSQLSEIVIKSDKKIFRMESGGISADIQHTPLENMGSLPDVLGQMPFVVKEGDDYKVFGKGAPIFYINNRRVLDPEELRQISSKNLKKVRVITNPGAEYDASTNAVIKIETIRPAGEGLSGSIYTFNRYNSEYSTLSHLSLNYRMKKLDIFTDMEFAAMSFPKNRTVKNTIAGKDTTTEIDSRSRQKDGFRHLIPQLGLNYAIDKNHSVGLKYEYNNTYHSYGNYQSDVSVLKNDLLKDNLFSNEKIGARSYSHYLNAYYSGKATDWLSIQFDFDYKTVGQRTNNHTENTSEKGQKTYILTSERGNSDLYGGKLTFNTLLQKGNLSYGSEISHTCNKENFEVGENTNDPGIAPSDNRVVQNLYAGFISYSRSYGNLSADLGCRYEKVGFKYYEEGKLSEDQSRTFYHLFPNAGLSFDNRKIQMQIAFRNTVSRPSYFDLRSSVFYDAPYSYYSGNPSLKSTYQNSLTYMLMWKNLTFMTVYSRYENRIVYLPQLYLDNSILLKPVNIDRSGNLALSLNYAPTIGIWHPSLEISLLKDYLKYGTPSVRYDKPTESLNFRNNITLGGWQLGGDLHIRTKGNQDAEYLSATWTFRLYANKSFFKDKLMINLSEDDVFHTSDEEVTYLANKVLSYYHNFMHRQNFTLQLTYRFNTVKTRYKGNRATNELDRF